MAQQDPREIAKKICPTWTEPARRRVGNPVSALSKAILSSAREDLVALKEAAQELREAHRQARHAMALFDKRLRAFLVALDAARQTVAWLEGGPGTIPFEEIARQLCLHPELAREALLVGIDADLLVLAAGGVHFTCPLCEAEQ